MGSRARARAWLSPATMEKLPDNLDRTSAGSRRRRSVHRASSSAGANSPGQPATRPSTMRKRPSASLQCHGVPRKPAASTRETHATRRGARRTECTSCLPSQARHRRARSTANSCGTTPQLSANPGIRHLPNRVVEGRSTGRPASSRSLPQCNGWDRARLRVVPTRHVGRRRARSHAHRVHVLLPVPSWRGPSQGSRRALNDPSTGPNRRLIADRQRGARRYAPPTRSRHPSSHDPEGTRPLCTRAFVGSIGLEPRRRVAIARKLRLRCPGAGSGPVRWSVSPVRLAGNIPTPVRSSAQSANT